MNTYPKEAKLAARRVFGTKPFRLYCFQDGYGYWTASVKTADRDIRCEGMTDENKALEALTAVLQITPEE